MLRLLLLLTCNRHGRGLRPISPHSHSNTSIFVYIHLALASSPRKIQRWWRYPPPQNTRITIHIPTRLRMCTHNILFCRRIPTLCLRHDPCRTPVGSQIIINVCRTVRSKMMRHILVGVISLGASGQRPRVRISTTMSRMERRAVRTERIEERRHRWVHALRHTCVGQGMGVVRTWSLRPR